MFRKQALISVFDKDGVVDLAKKFKELNIEIISTGGTASVLRDAGIKIKEVSEITGFLEILDGRVKTLHPIVHAGILAKRDDESHMDTLRRYKIKTVDFVVCNLYPFEETIKKANISIEEVIENIDIGGSTLIRAAAKNCKDVIILTKPKQYNETVEILKSCEDLTLEQRRRLAIEAFSHTAQYDALITQYFRSKWTKEIFPENLTWPIRKVQNMRYGENPHQRGAFYKEILGINEPCISNAEQLQGKELSFNNILDSDCAIECVKEFPNTTFVIEKHGTPCGIASANRSLQAWKDAYATDKQSPFGGVVSCNREISGIVAEELSNHFLEVIIAPSFSPQALLIFKKKKNLRLLKLKGLDKVSARVNRKGISSRSVVGGFITQERDIWLAEREDWKIVTEKKPSERDLESMEFAARCVKHVKSNSVLFVKSTRKNIRKGIQKSIRTIAIGGGQTSRVDAVRIAIHKGKKNIRGSIMASDAFFPFRDGIDVAAGAGVKAIIQPGGSIRDKEVIQAANEHEIVMVLSGQRYFRH